MTVRLKNAYPGMPNEPKRIVIERDEQNRITSITAGGERPSDETIRRYRQSGGMVGGIAGGFGTSYGGMNLGAGSFGSLGLGFMVPVRRNGTTQVIPARDLTDSDLQTIGVRNMRANQLRSGIQERTRDTRTQSAMQQIQTYAQTNFPFTIPVGTSHQYTYVDDACMPDKLSNMAYASATDRVEASTYYDREDCQHVKASWERVAMQVESCKQAENAVSIEYNRLRADGHIQDRPLTWGYAAGALGGYVAGFGGGASQAAAADTTSGGLSGSGFAGNAYYFPAGPASDRGLLESNYQMCKWYETSWNTSGNLMFQGSGPNAFGM